MKYIKGVTFGYMTPRGKLADEKTKESLRLLKQETGADTVILALVALQRTAHSEEVIYNGTHMPTDEEVKEIIKEAKHMGLRVILKPMLNCMDGTWRAHINFFDIEVPCEPKWSNWFSSYNRYILHYAKIAEETGCEMLIIGCEMVQSERRSDEWRALIEKVRKVYSGLITYNTDKYQESNVKWWDAVDVISSSGYYPINDWDQQLERIEKIIKPYNKPFFFAEVGCMSSRGSSLVPNNWELKGEVDLEEQAEYYKVMFEKCSLHNWIQGFALWSWNAQLYQKEQGYQDDEYALYGKPACEVINKFYTKGTL